MFLEGALEDITVAPVLPKPLQLGNIGGDSRTDDRFEIEQDDVEIYRIGLQLMLSLPVRFQ
jgi:hypothetical protein